MPGLLLDMEGPVAVPTKAPDYGFLVSHQKVELDVDFTTQRMSGRAEIVIFPQRGDLRNIKIDARQCVIAAQSITVNGITASHSYEDPLKALDIPNHILWTADQFELQRERLAPLLGDNNRADGSLVINIPRGVRIEEIDPFSDNAVNPATQRAISAPAVRYSSSARNGSVDILSAVPGLTSKTSPEQPTRFQPLVISIPFTSK
jgi:transcription initiation factor TFIID subunit 2